MNSVRKYYDTAYDAEVPEGSWYYTFSPFFGDDPLDEEPHEK